ncbi:uncharacterized protein LOC113505573 [Trichoplusia ni]|uniref:Uncharacterized protein LOC113505573 n=1 Tax=Trichoplusia ni TaxID=7111 RepID=A0A7E5WUD3_TRINI|nr:uncharacterized protein LOC113505573 [Trichoplusia ni]
MDFTNKVVIVTGASSGIGAASAMLFAKLGAKLTLVGRDENRLGIVAKQCEVANRLQPLCIIIDLTTKGACETVVKMTVATYNKIDVLVNSAGKCLLGSLFDDAPEIFDELIDINLRVPYKLSHLALPHLVKTKGNIVNLNTTDNSRVRHGFLPFSISKAALDRFTKSAAVELATEGVRINSVQPGFTRTNILKNLQFDEAEVEHVYQCLSTKINIMHADEIANMIVFIASDLCPSMNGVLIKHDAGQTLYFY